MSGVNIADRLEERTSYGEAGPGAGITFRPQPSGGLRELLMPLLLFALGLGAFYGFPEYAQTKVGEEQKIHLQEVQKLNSELQEVTAQLANYDAFAQQARLLDSQKEQLERILQEVGRGDGSRKVVLQMIDLMVRQMPATVWLSKVEVKSLADRMVEIEGYAHDLQAIGDYMGRLEGAVFFPGIELVQSAHETLNDPSIAGGSAEAKKFTLRAQVVLP